MLIIFQLSSINAQRPVGGVLSNMQDHLRSQSTQNIRTSDHTTWSNAPDIPKKKEKNVDSSRIVEATNPLVDCTLLKTNEQVNRKDREELLNPDDIQMSTEISPTLNRKRASPQLYHRSLSTTVLEPTNGRNLVSFPPVRRDPRIHDNSTKRDQRHPGPQSLNQNSKHYRLIN